MNDAMGYKKMNDAMKYKNELERLYYTINEQLTLLNNQLWKTSTSYQILISAKNQVTSWIDTADVEHLDVEKMKEHFKILTRKIKHITKLNNEVLRLIKESKKWIL